MGPLDDLIPRVHPGLRVAVLTGAGISLESGVPIFRGRGSMWENPEARDLARRAGPPWNTVGTWRYYEWRRRLVAGCDPNAAHLTLAEMERYFEDFTLITQNVDGLHHRAGSRNVLELHGSMWRGQCPRDGALVDLPETPLPELPPRHRCGEALRIDVVQFGEPLDPHVLSSAFSASQRADLFLVVGTSGVVSPARDLPLVAADHGAVVIEVNREETALTPFVTHYLRGAAAGFVPRLWGELRSRAVDDAGI